MNNDLSLYTIALVVTMVLVQTLFHFSKPTREWLISSASKLTTWTLSLTNRFLHVFLMSPVKAESGVTKDTQK